MSPSLCEHTHRDWAFQPLGVRFWIWVTHTCPALSFEAVPLSCITSPWGISWARDASLVLNPRESRWA